MLSAPGADHEEIAVHVMCSAVFCCLPFEIGQHLLSKPGMLFLSDAPLHCGTHVSIQQLWLSIQQLWLVAVCMQSAFN